MTIFGKRNILLIELLNKVLLILIREDAKKSYFFVVGPLKNFEKFEKKKSEKNVTTKLERGVRALCLMYQG